MNEFKRLLDSSDNAEVRRLLRSAGADRPRRHAVERALVALGTTGVVTSAAATASATMGGVAVGSGFKSTTVTAAAIAKWFAIGIASGTIVGGSAGVIQRELARPAPPAAMHEPATTSSHVHTGAKLGRSSARPGTTASPIESTPPAASPNLAEPVAAAPNPAEAATPAPSPVEPIATAPLVATPVTSRVTAPRITVAASPNTEPSSSASKIPEHAAASTAAAVKGFDPANAALREEVELIDAARRAIAGHEVARAAAALERYAGTRVTGILDREAELLAIQLRELEGQHATAARLAERYIARHPADANAVRLRQLYDLPVRTQ